MAAAASAASAPSGGQTNKTIGEIKSGDATRRSGGCQCPRPPRSSEKLRHLQAARESITTADREFLDDYVRTQEAQVIVQGGIDEIKPLARPIADGYRGWNAAFNNAADSSISGGVRAVLGFANRAVFGTVDLIKFAAKHTPANPLNLLRDPLDLSIFIEQMSLGNFCMHCIGSLAGQAVDETLKPMTDPWSRGEYTEAIVAGGLEVITLVGPVVAKLGSMAKAATAARAGEVTKAAQASEVAAGAGKAAEATSASRAGEAVKAAPPTAATPPATPATTAPAATGTGPGKGLAISAKTTKKAGEKGPSKPAAHAKADEAPGGKTADADKSAAGDRPDASSSPDKPSNIDRPSDVDPPSTVASHADDAAHPATDRGVETPGTPGTPHDVDAPPARDPKQQPTGDLVCAGDPVDVVSGRVVMRYTDVALPATLPLGLERVHLSGHTQGRLFGAAWACTWDQRLVIRGAQVEYVAGDGMVLPFPLPQGDARTLARHGPDLDLRRTSTGFALEQRHGATLWFDLVSPFEARLTAISEPGGQRLTFGHDLHGRLARVTHSGGYRIDVTTGPEGRITALHLIDRDDGRAHPLAHYTYDDAGRLQSHARPGDSAIRWDYDDAGRVTRWSDRRGTWFEYHFDDAGRCVRTMGIDGIHSETFAYDTDRRITVHTDALGQATTYHHDAQLQVSCVVDALGGVTRTERDAFDRITRIVDPLDRVTRITYQRPDGHGRRGVLQQVIRADGTVQRFEADAFGRITTVVEADGSRWQRELDAIGRTLRITQPDGHATVFEHRAGQTLVTDAAGHVHQIGMDERGLVTTAKDPLGHTTHYTRDAFGNVRLVTDAASHTTRFEYTAAGRLTEALAPDGSRQAWRYDDEGVLAEHIDPLGRTTRHRTRWFDLPAGITAPDGATLSYRHDAVQQLIGVTDALGRHWTYERDALGRVVAETDFNGRTLRYAHDLAGQCIAQTNALGETTCHERDAMGRLTARIAPDGRRTQFEHDALGRLIAARNEDAQVEFKRDVMGRVVEETCNGQSVRSSYDALGRRTQRQVSLAAGFEASDSASALEAFDDASISLWQYDANGLPQTLSFQAARSAGADIFHFRHDVLGRETERRFSSRGAELRLAQRFDTLGRLTHQSALSLRGSDERLLQQRSWQYDPAGQLTQHADGRHGVTRFERDVAGRVTQASSSLGSERYAYDLAGQVIETARLGSKAAAEAATSTEGARAYDGTRLQRAGAVSYRYDAQGRVVERSIALPLGAALALRLGC